MTSVSIKLNEWETRCPDPGTALADASLKGDQAAQSLALQLTSAGKIEVLELVSGIELRATSFVGSFLLGHLSVTIRPKIPGAPLLNLLRYAYGLRHLDIFGPVGHAISECSFQDLLIHQLASEVAELLSRGLYRNYRRTPEDLSIPRGRLAFQAYARTAARAGVTLPCVHHPRTEDTLINQVLLAGLGLASRLTDDIELRTGLRRLAQVLGLTVSDLRLDSAIIIEARQSLDRRTVAYTPALTLIELLLESKGIALDDGGRSVQLPGFLFDMNRFFQALMSRFLGEHLPAYSIKGEPRLRGMFAYDAAHNPRRLRAPIQKPDFVLMQGTTVAGVIDAKYRDLWERSLPRDMLYQLALYALGPAGALRRSVILYPTLDSAATEQVIVVQEPIYGSSKAFISLRPVNLTVLDGLIAGALTEGMRRKRTEMAQYLALGARP